jgi:hypothetical protein
MWTWLLGITAIPFFLYLYIKQNDKGLTRLAPEALAFSPSRYTDNDTRSTAKQLAEYPISVLEQVPTKTGRRYIVVGGVSVVRFVSLSNIFTGYKSARRGFSGDGLFFIYSSEAKIPKLVVSIFFEI